MSIRVMSLVWDKFPGSGTSLLTMLAFSDYSNDEGGNIFPSMATIAKRLRTSESQARRVVHKLIKNEWVFVTANNYGGAPGSSRHYRIDVEKLTSTPSVGATPSTRARGGTSTRDRSHQCAKRGGTGASLTVIEPSLTISPKPSLKNEVYLTKKKRNLKGQQLEWFLKFWELFGYKSGKAEAADAWLDLHVTEKQLPEILRGATFEANRRQSLYDEGKTPKMAQGWLSGRRFEDEISTITPTSYAQEAI